MVILCSIEPKSKPFGLILRFTYKQVSESDSYPQKSWLPGRSFVSSTLICPPTHLQIYPYLCNSSFPSVYSPKKWTHSFFKHIPALLIQSLLSASGLQSYSLHVPHLHCPHLTVSGTSGFCFLHRAF